MNASLASKRYEGIQFVKPIRLQILKIKPAQPHPRPVKGRGISPSHASGGTASQKRFCLSRPGLPRSRPNHSKLQTGASDMSLLTTSLKAWWQVGNHHFILHLVFALYKPHPPPGSNCVPDKERTQRPGEPSTFRSSRTESEMENSNGQQTWQQQKTF